MIQIPRYEPQVAEQAIPTPQVGANLPDAAFGGGAGLSRVAEEANAYKREQLILAEQEADRQAEIRASSFRRDMNQWEQDNVYNKDTGAESRKGANANGVYNDLNIGFSEWADKYSKGLTNDRQRRDFQALRDARWSHIGTWANRHEAREGEVWELGEYKKNLESSKSRASIDPSTADTEAGEIVANVEARARKEGVSPDLEIKREITDLHTRVVNTLLSQQSFTEADGYFQRVEAQMNEPERKVLRKNLQEGRVLHQAREATDKIFEGQLGYGKDVDGVGREDVAPAATLGDAFRTAQGIKDKDVRDAALPMVVKRWGMIEDMRKEEYGAKHDFAARVILETGDANNVPPDVRRALRPEDWQKLRTLEGGYAMKDNPAAMTELYAKHQDGSLAQMTTMQVQARYQSKLTENGFQQHALGLWKSARGEKGARAKGNLLISDMEQVMHSARRLKILAPEDTLTTINGNESGSIPADPVKMENLHTFREEIDRRRNAAFEALHGSRELTDKESVDIIRKAEDWAAREIKTKNGRFQSGQTTARKLHFLSQEERDTQEFVLDPRVEKAIIRLGQQSQVIPLDPTEVPEWISKNRALYNKAVIAHEKADAKGLSGFDRQVEVLKAFGYK